MPEGWGEVIEESLLSWGGESSIVMVLFWLESHAELNAEAYAARIVVSSEPFPISVSSNEENTVHLKKKT